MREVDEYDVERIVERETRRLVRRVDDLEKTCEALKVSTITLGEVLDLVYELKHFDKLEVDRGGRGLTFDEQNRKNDILNTVFCSRGES